MPDDGAAEDGIDSTVTLALVTAAPVADPFQRLHRATPRPRASLLAQLLATRLDAPAYRSRRREDPAIASEAYRAAAKLGWPRRNHFVEEA